MSTTEGTPTPSSEANGSRRWRRASGVLGNEGHELCSAILHRSPYSHVPHLLTPVPRRGHLPCQPGGPSHIHTQGHAHGMKLRSRLTDEGQRVRCGHLIHTTFTRTIRGAQSVILLSAISTRSVEAFESTLNPTPPVGARKRQLDSKTAGRS